MDTIPTIDVIIPTYNRKNSLLRTIESLKQQTFPMDRLGLIVVDDGSVEEGPTLAEQDYPFAFRCVAQKNQGATVARNRGAALSNAEILVFMDDDVTIAPPALCALAETCLQATNVVVIGTISQRSGVRASPYSDIVTALTDQSQAAQKDVDLHFVRCNTQLLACRRTDFIDLGMFQDPTGGRGWPNWDDVDFGYRAHVNGFQLRQSSQAIADHWDYSVTDWTLACRRWYEASKSVVWLFNRHQELQTLIPMFDDKTALVWGKDSPLLMARKLGRAFVSSQPILKGITRLVRLMERHYPIPAVLREFYHWLHGAYMFHGYRAGLREYRRLMAQQ
jgi:glycosyltransferase involved in cell wall biosynthesis